MLCELIVGPRQIHESGKSQSVEISSRAKDLEKATLGQLVTLLRLIESESVADLGRGKKGKKFASAGVNARQKIVRLERALRLGRLTRRSGRVTVPTDIGTRVAGEARLFLQGLKATQDDRSPSQTWVLAAGGAWLQSIIVPAISRLARKRPHWRWELHDMRARDICNGLRNGEVHFGFVRVEDARRFPDLSVTRPFAAGKFLVVAADAKSAPATAAALIRWLVANKRSLIQQGSSWKPIADKVEHELGLHGDLVQLVPQVSCTSYFQSLAATEFGSSWCIVPASLERFVAKHLRVAPIDIGSEADEVALVIYRRAIDKFSYADDATKELRDEIRTQVLGR